MEALPFSENVKYPELVFGLVGPIGVNMNEVQEKLADALRQVFYNSDIIHISKLLKEAQAGAPDSSNQLASLRKIESANAFCEYVKSGAALAALSILRIRQLRVEKASNSDGSSTDTESVGVPKHAYIIRQLKRVEEIKLLRAVYGQKFVQISVTLDKESRIRNLVTSLACEHPTFSEAKCEEAARKLIDQDENEEGPTFGQQVGEIFHLGDFFINSGDSTKLSENFAHFARAFFGDNSKSPNRDEFGAYTAAAAALRSADLSRQVGAAIFDTSGSVVSLGCNEVPKAGGGNYWYGDSDIMRDFERGAEQNSIEKQRIIMDSLLLLQKFEFIDSTVDLNDKTTREKLSTALDEALVSDITEYGRMTHAEMSAICDAARLGRALSGTTIFVTTFPCHNCAKHIIAAGIRRVVYIEPYPKSRAASSHSDSVVLGKPANNHVVFEHFEGISPRRYRDIFSKGKRKTGFKINPWYEGEPIPRIEQRDNYHIRREMMARVILRPFLEGHA